MRRPNLKLQSYIALAIAALMASSSVLATTYTFRVSSQGLKATNPVPIWAVTGSPATVFLAANIGDYATPDLTIPVKNTGSGSGSLSMPAFTGTNPSDFSETSNCTNIAPNVSCAITVRFKPAAAGNRVAVLTIGTNPLNFTGTGVSTPVIPANCRKDSANEAWCLPASAPLTTTGAQVCGYASNYSGTYYAATAAAATAWGKTLASGPDCATNYLTGASQVRVSSLSCWANQARWGRTGADSNSSVFVRCTSYE